MKLKYKVGTLVEVKGRGYRTIEKIAYLDDAGETFTEEEILNAYTPKKERGTKSTTKRASRKTKNVVAEEEAAVN